MKLEIKFSWEVRMNDHDVPKYTLYDDGKPVYSARYESCVVNYINENYARQSSPAPRKYSSGCQIKTWPYKRISKIEMILSKPMVQVGK